MLWPSEYFRARGEFPPCSRGISELNASDGAANLDIVLQ
ncbi:MAG: hypothetical protein BJ554DRAFT_5436, partial [Olpidium bornovanus]